MNAIKQAAADHEILDILRERWSPRSFLDRPIPRTVLRRLLEAARWAASSFNEQPWRFVITERGTPAHERLFACLTEGNRAWAGGAPILGLSIAKLAFAKNAKPNRHASHDVGAAMACLSIQATSLGVAVHQMAGYDVGAARLACHVPDGFDPVAAFVIGYPGPAEALDEKNRKSELAPRTRLPVSELAFLGEWGQPML